MIAIRWSKSFNRISLLACLGTLLAVYGHYYWADVRRPHAPGLSEGWWTFSDQGRYLTETLAWAAWDLDPAKHWYLPGYSLLALPFLTVTKSNPFLVPDAVSLLASLWLTAALAARLMPGWPLAKTTGALAFLLTAALPDVTDVWVTPWTTTPTAPLILGCLLALLRYRDQPGSWRAAGMAGLCAGGIGAFRPADSVLMLALMCGVVAASLAADRQARRSALPVIIAAGLGVAGPLALTVGLYVLVNGFQMSSYLSLSSEIGFEWRLLPLQWVTIVLDPQPMLPDGQGLLPAFPFIATGLAGMAACLAAPPGRSSRGAHAVVIAGAAGYGALYLCYRDLHPPGLWTFYNYHYFKWLLPVLMLYSVLLVMALPRWQATAAALCLLAAVLPWRAGVEVQPPYEPSAAVGRRLELPPLEIGTGVIAAVNGPADRVYNGETNYYFGANDGLRWYGGVGSLVAYPISGGMLVTPLRQVVPGAGHVLLDPAVSVEPSFPPRLARLTLSYGLPCYLPHWLGSDDDRCHSAGPIPPPERAMGQAIVFDAAASPLLVLGWDKSDWGTGMWTVGYRAGLQFRLRPTPVTGAVVVVKASAFMPAGSPPLDVALQAGGRIRAHWQIGVSSPQTLRAEVPLDAFGTDGLLRLEFLFKNPHRPSEWLNSMDGRLLGLRVASVTVTSDE